MSGIRHSDLVKVAAKWLARTCSVVVTEMATTGEEPDAIGWHGTHSTLVECKASRTDFVADSKKSFRQLNGWQGIGQARYFLAPAGVISLLELPANWGLLELSGDKLRCLRKSNLFTEVNARHEIGILLSALRRIGQACPAGVSIRCYTIESLGRATLGIGMPVTT